MHTATQQQPEAGTAPARRRYKATLAHNVRAYRYTTFMAQDDAEAIEKARNIEEWGHLDCAAQTFEDADVPDEVISLDEICEDDNRVVADIIEPEGMHPYGRDAQRFVEAVAKLDPLAPNHAFVLFRLIQEAKKLCEGDNASG